MSVYKEEEFPEGTQLHKPDGSIYVFAKVVDDMEPGTYVEFNVNASATKFKGGLRFPQGIVEKTVPRGWYTFVLVRPAPVQRQTNPSGGILVPNEQ